MPSQGNVKGYVFQKQAWRPLILRFYFYFLSFDDSVCKKQEKINLNFNNTHTSLIERQKMKMILYSNKKSLIER